MHKKYLLFLLPVFLFTKDLELSEKLTIDTVNNTKERFLRNKFLIKLGPASTIIAKDNIHNKSDIINYLPSKKTRVRPTIGISYRNVFDTNHLINSIETTCSFSYNDIERKKRNFKIGEIFIPKISILHFFSRNSKNSYYLGPGLGILSFWQNESHTKSPSLLASKDDDIYNTRSFSFLGAAYSTTFGYEMHRDKEISSGIQLELNSPLFPFIKNTGNKPPFSLELTYIAGF